MHLSLLRRTKSLSGFVPSSHKQNSVALSDWHHDVFVGRAAPHYEWPPGIVRRLGYVVQRARHPDYHAFAATVGSPKPSRWTSLISRRSPLL